MDSNQSGKIAYLIIAGMLLIMVMNSLGALAPYELAGGGNGGVYRVNRWTGDIVHCWFDEGCKGMTFLKKK